MIIEKIKDSISILGHLSSKVLNKNADLIAKYIGSIIIKFLRRDFQSLLIP